ncbi:membrane protein insertase YidC [Kangiella sediminilitoris]|uniref:Membrane protein insertase YidC n=1 Tax=Kangiella sediminilitoris TaxID=1144748 RepID=A0A1B3BE40_9GAMM|nr:membrane protein insertase YidC [Kangiella sediminilitoris]AOE51038.1 Membrane protein insertase YidC [Kangiella sediminilitoris]
MESMRGFFILGLAICTFLLYQAWQKDYGPQPTQQASVSEEKDVTVATEGSISGEDLIDVETDLVKFKIKPNGGDIVYAELKKYNVELNSPDNKVVLFDYRDRMYQAKSALLGQGAPDNQLPRARYETEKSSYKLAEGKDELVLPLTWMNDEGVTFSKTFKFKRGEYLVEMEYSINNQSSHDRTYNFVAELSRDQKPTGLEEKSSFGMKPFMGVAYSPEEQQYEKIDFEELAEEPIKTSRQGGWIGFLQHYFVSAWIPQQDQQINITSSVKQNKDTTVRFVQPTISVPANQQKTIGASLYVGPKDLEQLEAAAPGLDKSLDLSWVWWIGLPLYKMMQFFFSFLGNWGLAIILVTIVIKTLLYPLSAAQYRSMANMRKLQPKMQRLKERYGDDKQRMQQEMMKMYKEEGANPFGGCLPMLLQFPIFIALYYVLFEAVELRHAPFFGWIQDLSVADPYFVLPLLMGGSMWLMQRLQPKSPTMDQMQQKIMSYLPVLFTVFMLFFPAGLVLYWLCNNLISVAQQQYVTKKIERQDAAGKKAAGKK